MRLKAMPSPRLSFRAARAPILVAVAAVLVSGGEANVAAQEAVAGEVPARFLPEGGYTPPTIAPLRAPARWTDGPKPSAKTTAAHVEALRKDPLHQQAFWVEVVGGARDAKRTIVVIPQFHRSDTQPIDWTSLGEEIRQVQRNIDVITTRLARAHGLDCVATEGSALNNIQTPMELKQLAAWHRDLQLAHAVAQKAFADRGEALAGPLRTVTAVLEEALKQRLVLLDGVGVALSRLPPDERESIRRLGLEDSALNNRGVELLKKITAIEEELALLEPATQSTTAGVMGVMWLDEYPAYAARVLDPFDAALAALDRERKALLNRGALDAADVLRRFSARSKLIAGGLIRSDEVRGYQRYYQEVEDRALDAVDAGPQLKKRPRRLTKKERRTKARLEKKRAKLLAEYTRVTEAKREQHAAARVLSALPADDGAVCAVVMGANHQAGLVAALESAAKAQKAPVGVVVVAPFHFE